MKKLPSKFYLFIAAALAVLASFLIWTNSALAQTPPNLEVTFDPNPLFKQVNFAPGETTTGRAQVKNNTAQTQKVQIEAINQANTGGLAEQLDFVVKQGENILYAKTLKQFFGAGQIYLSDLASGGSAQYDISVTFNSETGNDLQGKITGFDLLVGFLGQEGGGGDSGGGSSGGGGGLPPGLTIYEDQINVTVTGQTTAIINWTTSYNSTSQVVYASPIEWPSVVFAVDPTIHYGYPHAAPDPEDSGKAANHTVTLTGLTPDTIYHFRVISHASPPTVSFDHTFTTWPNGLSMERGVVAGEQTTTPSGHMGQISGAAATTRNLIAAAKSGQPGEVLGEATTSPASVTELPQADKVAAGNAGGLRKICKNYSWWKFGYLVYIILLALVFWLFRSRKKVWLGPVFTALALAALAWWWLEPCSGHLWVWPAGTVILYLLAIWQTYRGLDKPPAA